MSPKLIRQHIPGVSLLVNKDDKVVLTKGYGLANVEHQVPVKPETVFQSGSVGKQFAATAVMMSLTLAWLIETGGAKAVSLDPSHRYFRDGSGKPDGAYMADLLCLNMLEAPDQGIALAQLAYLEGPLRLAHEVGLPCVASGAESLAELYDRLERGVLLRANSVISRRSFSPQLRSTLRDGQALLLGRKKSATQAVDDDMQRGLGGMSISMAVNEDVQKIFEGDVNRRVALQLGQATRQAREAQAKKASEQKSTSS